MAEVDCRELVPERWDDLERLFGERGACGGCWCMSWRTALGERWEQLKGETNRQRFKALVLTGQAHGALAYAGVQPVGWCSFDRRRDFLRLDRAPSLACDDADQVWSLPCFYIHPKFRAQGVAAALLAFALGVLRDQYRAAAIEAYPVKSKAGQKLPAAFAWTGTASLFLKAGFQPVGKLGGGRQRMRWQP